LRRSQEPSRRQVILSQWVRAPKAVPIRAALDLEAVGRSVAAENAA
jgi:hypothetical protein